MITLPTAERKILETGDDVRIFLPFRPTKKLHKRNFFDPGILIDSSYLQWDLLKDPAHSDMPTMEKLEALGLFERVQNGDLKHFADADGLEWVWKRTRLGRKLANVAVDKPEPPRFSIKCISENEAELVSGLD